MSGQQTADETKETESGLWAFFSLITTKEILVGVIPIILSFILIYLVYPNWDLIKLKAGCAFEEARQDEFLVVVAPFEHLKGEYGVVPHRDIIASIQQKIDSLEISDRTRVEESPVYMSVGDSSRARDIMNSYSADLVIWGDVTRVETTISYMSGPLKTTVSESDVNYITSRQTKVSARQYTQFITREMPLQASFFALYALAWTYSGSNLSLAATLMESAVRSLPEGRVVRKASKAYEFLGFIHNVNGEYEKAKSDLDLALEIDSTNELALLNRGAAFIHLDEYGRAVNDLDRAVSIDSNSNHLANRAVARHLNGNVSGAKRDISNAIDMKPNNSFAYTQRGVIEGRSGEHDTAIQYYSKAINYDNKNVQAHRNRGIARLQLGRPCKARRDFTQAIRFEGDNPENWYRRGKSRLMCSESSTSKAFSDFKKAREIDPSYPESYSGLANVYFEWEQYSDALKMDTRAIKMDPKDANKWRHRGITYRQIDSTDEALSDFLKSISINPTFGLAYYDRGQTYLVDDNPEKALEDFKKAKTLGVESPSIFAFMGTAHYQVGDTLLAKRMAEKSLRLEPNSKNACRLIFNINARIGTTPTLPERCSQVDILYEPENFPKIESSPKERVIKNPPLKGY